MNDKTTAHLNRIVIAMAMATTLGICFHNRVLAEEITEDELLLRVETLQEELDRLRRYVGRPKLSEESDLPVSGAQTREVYFQALSLFKKADRFCFENTRLRGKRPVVQTAAIRPSDIDALVNAALLQLRKVSDGFGLERMPDRVASASEAEMDHIFHAIVRANRQLNLMLETPVKPSDVYQQVTVAIGYSERLLERFPHYKTKIPKPPAYEPNKMPRDVYRRLLNCCALVERISEASGVKQLQLGAVDANTINAANPGDVYDVASLLVSELAYLHERLPESLPPRKAYYPGKKFPSDVYQRVGLLEKQLSALETLVNAEPNWLEAPAELELDLQ
jgi:hypothetical protein